MRCDDLNEILEAYLDGDLTPGRCVEVEAHLAGCAGCRKALELARQVAFELRALPGEACPDTVTERVRERVRHRVRRQDALPRALFRRRILPAWSLRIAAVLMALAAIFTYFLWLEPAGKEAAYSQDEIARARRGIVLALDCVDHAMHRTRVVMKKENVPERILRPLNLDTVFKGSNNKEGEKS